MLETVVAEGRRKEFILEICERKGQAGGGDL